MARKLHLSEMGKPRIGTFAWKYAINVKLHCQKVKAHHSKVALN